MPYPTFSAQQHSHRVFPSPVTGYALNGRWEVVEPIGVNLINLVSNPSVELNTTGYSAQGAATIAQDSADQRRGVYSLKVTPTSAQLDGAFYGTVTLAGQQTYTLAFDFKGAGGVKYRYYMASTLNNAISPVTSFIATGRWQRVTVTFREPSAAGVSTGRRMYITKDFNTSIAPFRIDGLCVTNTPYPVLYFDGDSLGFIAGRVDFYWNGTRHGSTSTMANYTRAGGRITPFSKFGLAILAMLGLGMQPLNNISTPQALIGGSQYQRTVSLDRVFDIAGALTGRSLPELQRKRRELLDLFKPDATPTDSPMLLLYTPVDDCGDTVGETLEIQCVYENGLEGTVNNHYQENLDLRFHSFLPFLANGTGEHGQVLGYQIVQSSGQAFIRDNLGNWRRMGDGLNNTVNAVLPLADGRLLIAGDFVNAQGDANADYLAYYDPATNLFSSVNATPLSGGTPTSGRALALLPDGNRVLVGGNFANAGGFPSADNLCILNLTTGAFSAANLTPLSNNVNAIVTLNNGDFIIGGDFNDAGNANGDKLVRLNGSTFAFQALNANPLNAQVYGLAKLFNGDVIFVGAFTSASGLSNIQHTGYLNVTTGAYSALNTSPLANNVFPVAVGLDGRVYLGENDIYSWSGPGAPFNLLGAGVGLFVFTIIPAPNGEIYIGGSFTQAGGISLPSHMAGWNGSSYFAMDFAGGSVDTFPQALTPDNSLILTTASAVTGPSAYVNTIVNNGPHDAYPVFEILGPGAVYQIKNYSTGEALYFNLTLNSGERAILDLTPGRIRFSSNFRPNLLGTILPGSALATWRLVPGSNAVSVFIAGTVNASTSITARWRDCHWGIDSAIGMP